MVSYVRNGMTEAEKQFSLCPRSVKLERACENEIPITNDRQRRREISSPMLKTRLACHSDEPQATTRRPKAALGRRARNLAAIRSGFAERDSSLRSPENHTTFCRGTPWRAPTIFISSGGPTAHGNSVESHVIPAEAGTHRTWVPAFAGTTRFETFKRMGGPQAHEHSG